MTSRYKTRWEFMESYASGMDVVKLLELGLVPKRCRCGEVTCQGWQVTHPGHDLVIEYQLWKAAQG